MIADLKLLNWTEIEELYGTTSEDITDMLGEEFMPYAEGIENPESLAAIMRDYNERFEGTEEAETEDDLYGMIYFIDTTEQLAWSFSIVNHFNTEIDDSCEEDEDLDDETDS